MPNANLRGQRFYYKDTGGEKPPIVFTHGFLMDHSMWTAQVDEFSAEYRVITWDSRGFGRTEVDGAAYTVWDETEDLVALLDHLGLDRPILVGHSHGGYLTMRVPLIARDRVAALVLVDTNAAGLTAEQADGYRRMFGQWAADGPNDLADVFASIIIAAEPWNEIWKDKWLRRAWHGMPNAARSTVNADDVRARLGEISVPTLVIHASEDNAFPIESAHDIAHSIKSSVGPVIVPGGHTPVLTHPETANAAIREFLGTL
jgi:3-oxoadipate enol-lactonase